MTTSHARLDDRTGSDDRSRTRAQSPRRRPGGRPLLAAGCLIAGLTPAQSLWACTAGGARALRLDDRGVVKTGARADLALFATKDPAHLPYHAGVEHAQLVVRGGQIVHQASAPTCD